MNIRFDNESNMIKENKINENKMNHGVNAYNTAQGNVRESGIAKYIAGATFEKNDSVNGMNAYKDKNDALATETGLANIMNEAEIQKDYMVLMSNTVSDEDYKKLEENGFKPGSMTPEETVTIVDEIKATMAKSGNVIEGYNDDLDRETLSEITGSAAYASQIEKNVKEAYESKLNESPELKAAFDKYNLPETETNINEAIMALNMAMEINGINDGAMKVLVEGNSPASVNNIYLANYSGKASANAASGYFMDANGYLGKKSDEINDAAIRQQVSKVIEAAGYEVNDNTIADAFKMIDDGMTLTEDSFAKYEEIKNIEFPLDKQNIADKIAMTMKDGLKAKDTSLTEDKSILERAKELVETANSISDEAIAKTVEAGKPVNLKNLAYAQRTIVINASVTTVSMTASARGYVATMSEIRLSMTVSSTSFLLKNGIDVNTEDLSKLVDELKEAGNRQFEALFGKEYSVDQGKLKELYDETTGKIDALKGMPMATVGLMSSRTAFSLNVLYEEGKTLQNKYLAAGEKYEPLMTEVRGDLGDSIKKAFGNVDDILKEMNLDISEENERAVRILGYNNQEITTDSIDNVKAVYEKVHNVIAKMTPAKTLELIRDGVNPLQTNLEELEEKLDVNPLSPVEEAERYSHFLYRMEKSGQIAEDERESFIGIYRMINAIEKDDGAAIGTLIGTNGEINFKNLVSAVRTRHNKGIDAKVNDEFGGLDKLNFKNATITEQIEKAFKGISSELSDNYDSIEMQYIKENADEIRQSGPIKESVIDFLVENNIVTSMDNLKVAREIVTNRGKIYRNITKLSEKSTKNNGNVDKNVDNSDASRGNVDKTLDFTSESLDKLAESLTDKESAQAAFAEMYDRIDNMLSAESLKAGNYIDVKDITASMKQMNVVRNLMNNECYEVPAYLDGMLTSIRVSVLHKGGQMPNVNISLETESYGKVSASFGLTDVNLEKMEGFIVCDNESGLAKLRGAEEALRSAKLNINLGTVNYFKSSNTNVNYFANKSDNNSSKELYNTVSNGLGTDDNKGKDANSNSAKSSDITKSLYLVAKEFIKMIA